MEIDKETEIVLYIGALNRLLRDTEGVIVKMPDGELFIVCNLGNNDIGIKSLSKNDVMANETGGVVAHGEVKDGQLVWIHDSENGSGLN